MQILDTRIICTSKGYEIAGYLMVTVCGQYFVSDAGLGYRLVRGQSIPAHARPVYPTSGLAYFQLKDCLDRANSQSVG